MDFAYCSQLLNFARYYGFIILSSMVETDIFSYIIINLLESSTIFYFNYNTIIKYIVNTYKDHFFDG